VISRCGLRTRTSLIGFPQSVRADRTNGSGPFFRLVERAWEKGSAKRGGTLKRLDIDAVDLATTATPQQLLAIDDALAKLARDDPSAAKLVELRYFAGLTVDEAGKALGMSTATAYRHWNYARAWLHGELLGTAES